MDFYAFTARDVSLLRVLGVRSSYRGVGWLPVGWVGRADLLLQCFGHHVVGSCCGIWGLSQDVCVRNGFAVIVAFIVCHANLLVCLADTGVPNNALHRFLISQRAPCYCYAFLMCALVIRGVGWPLGSWDGRAVRLADCEGPG